MTDWDAAVAAAAASAAVLAADAGGFLAEHEGELVALRRHLHTYPELSGREAETTALLCERLRVAGLEPHVLSGGTGVVCDVGAGDGPTVVLRADIDALAMDDRTQTPFRSRVPGVAHACGHDLHTVVVLGAGLVLQRVLRSTGRRGRVRLVFEPAEESVPGGAVDVIDEGWLREVAAVYAVHCDPKIPAGTVGLREGAITSAADVVEIVLSGPGGHTARPDRTVDLVQLVGETVTRLPTRVRDGAASLGRLDLVFGAVHAGEAANVVPSRAVLRGSLRTPDRTVWEAAPEVLGDAVAGVLGGSGATYDVVHTRGVPPVLNEPRATRVMGAVAGVLLGEAAVQGTEHSLGGDSFAWYLDHAPGCYARLGVGRAGQPGQDLHAATFDPDEAAIGHGVRLLAGAALATLAGS